MIGRASAVAVALIAAVAAPASAAPGPTLYEPHAALDRALECTGDVRVARRSPVLLVHGTWTDPDESWRWGYVRALRAAGFPTCTVTLPGHALGDVQRSAEYVVHAIRRVSGLGRRKLAVVGHSQGGLLPLWVLRFWPDLASRMSDVVTLSAVHRGWNVQDDCSARCPFRFPSAWQMTPGSRLLRALGRRPLPAGPSYTAIASQSDLIVTPEGARVDVARNVVVQDLCPGRPVDHATMLGDAVAFAVVLDALTHRGAADPARVGLLVCAELGLPGIDIPRVPPAAAGFGAAVARSAAIKVDREPRLRCYARPDCR